MPAMNGFLAAGVRPDYRSGMAILIFILIWIMGTVQDAFNLCESIAGQFGATCVG